MTLQPHRLYSCIVLICSLFPLASIAQAPERKADKNPAVIQARRLELLVERADYFTFRQSLEADTVMHSAIRSYFEGIAAAKFNRPEQAEQKLKQVIESDLPERLRMKAHDYLGEVYARSGAYQKAANEFSTILSKHLKVVPAADLKDYREAESIFRALQEVPSTRRDNNSHDRLIVEWTDKHTIGNGLKINGTGVEFGFDTGANFSICSETAAQKLKLKAVHGPVSIGTINEKKLAANFRVADEVSIGDSKVHNVVFLVIPDESMRISGLDGVIGFPVAAPFRKVVVRFGKATASVLDSAPKSPIALDGFNILGAGDYGPDRLTFSIDTGASNTDLYPKFMDHARKQRARLSAAHEKKSTGLAGGSSIKIRSLLRGELQIAGRTVVLQNTPVWMNPTTEGSKRLAGNIGHDVFAQLGTIIFDFQEMSLSSE